MIDSYEPRLFKFSGAGNDFVVLDGRSGGMEPFRDPQRIGELCREYRTDGLMILTQDSPGADFTMEFYNPDGSGGMMCGNGGRCIVAFAHYLGLRPAAPDGTWLFRAPDGPHEARILSHCGSSWTVRLKMIDVQGIESVKGGYFLNTGTRHLVCFVADVEEMDVESAAKPLRWDPAFAPEGTNVNFVQVRSDGLHVRTFEKGVEGETLACGTGLTASALAAYRQGGPTLASGIPPSCPPPSPQSYRLQCRRGDWLQVDFLPQPADCYTGIYLTGPAELIPLP